MKNDSVLVEFEDLLANCDNDIDRLSIIYSIIDLKISENEYDDQCYLYAKEMIELELSTFVKRKYGYDQIKIEKYINIFEKFPISERISILEFLKQKLIQYNFSNSLYRLNSIIEKEKFKVIILRRRRFWFLKTLFKFPTLSIKHLIFTAILFFFVFYLVLLPAPFESWKVLEVSNYTFKSLIDHFFVSISLVFKINIVVELSATTYVGLVLLILLKIIIYIYISGFLLNEFNKRINLR